MHLLALTNWTLPRAVRSVLFLLVCVALTAVLLLPFVKGSLSAKPVAALQAPTVSLIYAGWFGNTIPTPAFIQGNKTFLESQPFDGLIVYLRNDSAGVNVTTGVMGGTTLSPSSITVMLAPLKNLGLVNLVDNFGLVQGSTPPDFFDDWTGTIQNFRNLAIALQDAGLRGICFDNEQYSKPWGDYPTGVKYNAKTLAEYQTQARLRGKEVMEAMVAVFPSIAIISLHGPYVSELKAPVSLQFPQWQSGNELLGPFSVGFAEGAGSAGLEVDGGEIYTLRTVSDFQGSYGWRKYDMASDAVNCPFIPSTLRPLWSTRTSISFGVYDQPFGGAPMNATTLETTLDNALHQADRYVWFYTEGASFLLPPGSGGASAVWVNAVRQALATIPVVVSLPAPQSLLGMPKSSSQVDVSWINPGTEVTGIKVERKTGSNGTFGQIAQVGSTAGSFSDTSVVAETTYFYRVRATNGTTDSAFSNVANATTPAPGAEPVPTPTPTPAPSGGGGGGGGGCGLLGVGAIVVVVVLRQLGKARRIP